MATLSRRERTDATRRATEQAIVDATVSLLGEGTAFADIGIEQIVRRAGFSRPTFYSYFRDKRELILRMGAELEAAVGDAAGPWLERGEGEIRDTLGAVLEAFRMRRETLGALVEAATYDPEVRTFWRGFHERFRTTAATRIRLREPDLPDANVQARAFALVWMTERTLTEYLGGATVDEQALIDELARLWQRPG